MQHMKRIAIGMMLSLLAAAPATPPAVGEKAPEFSLKRLDDKELALSELTQHGPVVLIVLRGFPGYQCPICTKQFAEFRKRSDDLAKTGATVLWIYPGPSDALKKHANDFLKGGALPPNFEFVIDPDYVFTNAYHLRWNKAGETAYPSTFVIDKDSNIRFAHISHSHGDRASVDQVLEQLK
jgi:peroxiredoxin Q/BCP